MSNPIPLSLPETLASTASMQAAHILKYSPLPNITINPTLPDGKGNGMGDAKQAMIAQILAMHNGGMQGAAPAAAQAAEEEEKPQLTPPGHEGPAMGPIDKIHGGKN